MGGLHRSLLLQSWVGLRDGAASVREHVLLAREEEVSSLLLLLEKRVKMIMPPWEDLFFVINNLLLGEEPSIEDFILLVGTSVAFIAFILWCCFPIEPKDSLGGSEHLTTQAADAVYDAKYKQLATSPACRKPGLQDLMQYDINT